MHSVEIAKATTGLHAIRLPSGGVTETLRETASNLYAVVSGTVRATIDGQADEILARGDVIEGCPNVRPQVLRAPISTGRHCGTL